MNPFENPAFELQATYALSTGRFHEDQDQQNYRERGVNLDEQCNTMFNHNRVRVLTQQLAAK